MAQRKRYCFRAKGDVEAFLGSVDANRLNLSQEINDAIQFYLDAREALDSEGRRMARVRAADHGVRLGCVVGERALAGLKGAKR